MIVLDTNVVSELVKTQPSDKVRSWAGSLSARDLFTTSVTKAEMLLGVALLEEGRRKFALRDRIDRVFSEDFAGRILPFDSAAASMLPPIAEARRDAGRPVGLPDLQIASIVRTHGAVLATRDTRDFEHCGLSIINPWSV